jgi:acetate kinase
MALFKMPEELCLLQSKIRKNINGDSEFVLNYDQKKHDFVWKEYSVDGNIRHFWKIVSAMSIDVKDALENICIAGHRLIHGGENNQSCSEINKSLLAFMEQNVSLAPLHYPANIEGIKTLSKLLPGVIQAGVFDTAFHQTLPEKAFLYGLPYSFYTDFKIRRYGFHGISHRYAAETACQLTGISFQKSRIISCHLGSGCSVAAILNGKSIDTSMGMTPAEGLLMGTRCGDIDSGVLQYLAKYHGYNPESIDTLLNRKSGLIGLSGISSDFREVKNSALDGNLNAKMAIEVFIYRIRKYIGAYLAVLEGVDLFVFTGGIGENDAFIRSEISKGFDFAGLYISEEKNLQIEGNSAEIGKNDSKVKVAVIKADEERMIAREVYSHFGFEKQKAD